MTAALVTGAGKRIGRELALCLAEQGYDVALHYNSSSTGADEAATEITAMGRKAVTLQADLLDDTQSAALLPRAVEALGAPITVLINNASIFEYDTLETATAETWDRHIGSNLRAPFLLSQAFAAQNLRADKTEDGEPLATGLIVNIVDQRVQKLTPEFMTYTISKMGLWAFTQTAARALAPAVRVNAIGPGPTLKGGRQSKQHFDAQRKNTVLGRGSDPSDIAASLVYLLSARAVTGQLICVDGGQHLGWETPDVIGVE
ncbi:short-chain dehydrogenase [Actibacterium mucosum KCTC 23349]|uniref:Short-chain dehydrogenase n=1 Tax=Actibacterium mucosum KCTC 23349 TaxID=1454373 RepID=A0A037ZEV9_9RHOB|nr:SDR family oxidoreductase [Actibacterium mucosum]KAJ54061.1 short-chain dehydrogenase [Actibacterium mucosum KCTC 23349]